MKLIPLRPSSAAAAAHLLLLLNLYCLIPQVISHQHQQQQQPIADSRLTLNGIPYSTRAYWMRKANQALSDLVSPCPFGAFGTVIVNHTANTGLGDLVCIGVNSIASTGNPIMHGMYNSNKNKEKEKRKTKSDIPFLSFCSRRRNLRHTKLHHPPLFPPRPLQFYSHPNFHRLLPTISLHQRRKLPNVRLRHPLGRLQRIHLRYIY